MNNYYRSISNYKKLTLEMSFFMKTESCNVVCYLNFRKHTISSSITRIIIKNKRLIRYTSFINRMFWWPTNLLHMLLNYLNYIIISLWYWTFNAWFLLVKLHSSFISCKFIKVSCAWKLSNLTYAWKQCISFKVIWCFAR